MLNRFRKKPRLVLSMRHWSAILAALRKTTARHPVLGNHEPQRTNQIRCVITLYLFNQIRQRVFAQVEGTCCGKKRRVNG